MLQSLSALREKSEGAEPGIYIPEEQIGVRIEDDVLVTPDGHHVLSDFPKEISEIEALMKR